MNEDISLLIPLFVHVQGLTPLSSSGRRQMISINEADEWVRRENPAMWEDFSDPEVTRNGKQTWAWKDYATDVKVPRGYDIRLRADTATRVLYAGKEQVIQADEDIYLVGNAEAEILELIGENKFATVMVATLENPDRKMKRREAEIALIDQIDARSYKQSVKKGVKNQPDIYDFTRCPPPFKVEVPFSKTKSVRVLLPGNATVEYESKKEDVEIVFGDGNRVIEGPGKKWKANPNNTFTMRGVEKHGVIRLILRPAQR